MTSFRKIWVSFVDSFKPQLLRESSQGGLHSVYVDTRPFQFKER
jgi:hypothetical protein